MAIKWHLKTYLARQHGIYRPTDIQALVVKKTNILISLPNISKLLNKKPSSIKLSTMEHICTALNCNLSDFCEVKPSKGKSHDSVKKLSFNHTPHSKRGVNSFPDPSDYE
jgi:DNA-binding Xre family transcriptional regulator